MRSKILWKIFLPYLLFILFSFLIIYSLSLNRGEEQNVWLIILIFGGLALMLAFVISLSIRRTLLEITDVAQRIAKGDFSRRLLPASRDEIGSLASTINQISQNLEVQFGELNNEKKQLKTILDGMIEGVLVTNGSRKIILANPAIQRIINIDSRVEGKTVLECLRSKEIFDTIEKVIKEKRPQEIELSIPVAGEERSLIVHTAPLTILSDPLGSVSVFYDVTEIRKLENMRKEFVANVSHELKTPLTCIRGYAETLRSGALNDASTAERFVTRIEENAIQLQCLVDDILKLSEIESGRMELHLQRVQLSQVLEPLVVNFKEMARSKNITLSADIKKPLPDIKADLQALKQILSNLIENAIKYTPEKGQVTITATPEDHRLKVDITDTGVGISEQDLSRIFERFYRADKARSRTGGGTGLGLSIVKHLVQAHDGEIQVKSQLGQGSQFSITIPLI